VILACVVLTGQYGVTDTLTDTSTITKTGLLLITSYANAL